MTDLDQALARWQKRLRLQDWDVRVEVKRTHSMEDGALGRSWVQPATRHALIRLLDPQDYDPTEPPDMQDTETTLVHELLHIAIPGDNSDGTSSLAQEQGIDAIARALVMLARSGKASGKEDA